MKGTRGSRRRVSLVPRCQAALFLLLAPPHPMFSGFIDMSRASAQRELTVACSPQH